VVKPIQTVSQACSGFLYSAESAASKMTRGWMDRITVHSYFTPRKFTARRKISNKEKPSVKRKKRHLKNKAGTHV
jgi:hypothetical protein